MTATKISRQDLEDRFRTIQGDIAGTVEQKKQSVMVIGAAGGVALLLLTYLLGRRSGKKRSAVVQIRRI